MSAVELAVIISVLVPVMMSGSEIDRYLRCGRHAWVAADSFASVLSQRATLLGGSMWTQDSDLIGTVLTEAVALYGAQWRNNIGLQATYVRFNADKAGCEATSTCTYSTATILWTWPGGNVASQNALGGQGLLRSCAQKNMVPGGSAATAKTLPANVFGGGNLLVVDLVYVYKPTFLSGVVGSRTIVRQAYYAPLYQDITIDPSSKTSEVAPCT